MRKPSEAAAPPSPVPMSTELNALMDSYTPENELSMHMQMPAYKIFDVAIETYDYELFRETLQTFRAHSNFEHLIGLTHYIKQKKEGANFRGSFFFRVLFEAVSLINQGEPETLNCDQFVKKYNRSIAKTGSEILDEKLTLSEIDIYMISPDGKTIDLNLVKKVFLTKIFSIIIDRVTPLILAYRFFWDLYNDPHLLNEFSKKTFLNTAKSSPCSDLVTSSKSPTQIAFENNLVAFLKEHYPHKKHYAWLIELKKTNAKALNISFKLDQFLHKISIIDKNEIKSDAYYQKRKKMHGADGKENYKHLMKKLESLPQNQETSDALLKEFKFNHAFSSYDEQSIIKYGLMSPKDAIEKGFKERSSTPSITVNSTVFGYAFNDPPLHKGSECNRVFNIPTAQLDSEHSWTSHHVVEYENQIEGNSYKFYGKKAGCFTTMDLRFKTHDSQRVLMISLHYSFIDGSSDIVTRTKTVNKPFNDEVYAGDLSKIMLGVFYERASLLKHEDDPSKNSPLERILEEPHYAITAANFLMTRRTFELHYDQTINVKQSGITITDNPAFDLMGWHSACTRAITTANAMQFEKLIRETPNPFIYTSIFKRENSLACLFSHAIMMHMHYTLSNKKQESKALEKIIKKIMAVGFHQYSSQTSEAVSIPFLLTGVSTNQIERMTNIRALEEILALDIYSNHLKEILISYIDQHTRLIPRAICNYLLLFFDETSSKILYQSEKKFCTFKEITKDMRKKIEAPLTDELQKIYSKRAIALHKTLKNKPVETCNKDRIEIKSLIGLYIVAKNKRSFEKCEKTGANANIPAANIILFLLKYNLKMNEILDFLDMNNLEDVISLLSSIINTIDKPQLIEGFELLEKYILTSIKNQLDKKPQNIAELNKKITLITYFTLKFFSHHTFKSLISLIRENKMLTTNAQACISMLLNDNNTPIRPSDLQKNLELYFENVMREKLQLGEKDIAAIKTFITHVATKIIENKIRPNTVVSYTILEILSQNEVKTNPRYIQIAQPLSIRNLLYKLKFETPRDVLTPIDSAYKSEIFRKIILKKYPQPDTLIPSIISTIYNITLNSIEMAYYHCKNYINNFNSNLTKNPMSHMILRLFGGASDINKFTHIPPSEIQVPSQDLYTKIYYILHMANTLVNKDQGSIDILKDDGANSYINAAIFVAFPITRKYYDTSEDTINAFFSNLLPKKITADGTNPLSVLETIFSSLEKAITYIKSDASHLKILSDILYPERIYTQRQIEGIIFFLKDKPETLKDSMTLLKETHPENLVIDIFLTISAPQQKTNLLSTLLLFAIEDTKLSDSFELILGEKSHCLHDFLKTPRIKNYLQDNKPEVFLSLKFFLEQLVKHQRDQGKLLTKFLPHFLGDVGFTPDLSRKLIFKNKSFFNLEVPIKDYLKQSQSVEKNKIPHLFNINYYHIDTHGTLLYEKDICVLTLFYLLDHVDKFKEYLDLENKNKKAIMLVISNVLDHATLPLSENKKAMLELIPKAFQGKKIFNKKFGAQNCGLFSLISSKPSEIRQALINLYYPYIISDRSLKNETHPHWLELCLENVPEDIKKRYQATNSEKRKSLDAKSSAKKARTTPSTESENIIDESGVAASSMACSSGEKTPKHPKKSPALTSSAKKSRLSPQFFPPTDDTANGAAAAASGVATMKTGK